MKIKEQTRKLAQVAQNTVLRLQIELTKSAQNTVLRLQIELTKSVTYTYGKATLTRFEEIFEEYETKRRLVIVPASF